MPARAILPQVRGVLNYAPTSKDWTLGWLSSIQPYQELHSQKGSRLRKLFDLPEATHWETCPVLSSAAMCSQCLRLMEYTKGLY